MPLKDAVEEMGEEVLRASRNGVPVVGMKVDFDLTMLDAHFRRCVGHGLRDAGFAGPVVDALVLDRRFDRFRRGRRTLVDLCREYGVSIGRAHDAAVDAQAAVGVVRALCRRYPVLGRADVDGLHRAQACWHREWLQSYANWRAARGLGPLDEGDDQWPIASHDVVPVGTLAAVI